MRVVEVGTHSTSADHGTSFLSSSQLAVLHSSPHHAAGAFLSTPPRSLPDLRARLAILPELPLVLLHLFARADLHSFSPSRSSRERARTAAIRVHVRLITSCHTVDIDDYIPIHHGQQLAVTITSHAMPCHGQLQFSIASSLIPIRSIACSACARTRAATLAVRAASCHTQTLRIRILVRATCRVYVESLW